MKVLLINGSSHEHGCTATALAEVAKELEAQGIETSIRWLGVKPIRDCVACGGCKNGGGCVFRDDPVNALVEEARNSDGFVFGTPVYYAHPSGRILCALDRMFYSGGSAFAFKPGAAIASARRAGTTASVDVLNKYFTINQMPVVSSGYWNAVSYTHLDVYKRQAQGLSWRPDKYLRGSEGASLRSGVRPAPGAAQRRVRRHSEHRGPAGAVSGL